MNAKCTTNKQAKPLNLFCYGEWWLKYQYEEAWQVYYTCKCHLLRVVEATTEWLETYPVPLVTVQNTILGLKMQVLWWHDTPERTELDNNFIDTWAKESIDYLIGE